MLNTYIKSSNFNNVTKISAGGRIKHRKPLKISIREAALNLKATRKVTNRDLLLLDTLHKIGLLSRSQIQRLFFNPDGHINTVNTRLHKLYLRHLIDYNPNMLYAMSSVGLEPCHIYTLGSVGAEILAMENNQTRQEMGDYRQYVGRGAQFIMHDLMRNEMFARTIVEAKTLPDTKVFWMGEKWTIIRDKTGKEIVRPDGLLVINQKGVQQHYFIELDRGSTRWPKKFQAYDSAYPIISQKANSENIHVLLVVPNGRKQTIASQVTATNHQCTYLIKEWKDVLWGTIFDDWYDCTTSKTVTIASPSIQQSCRPKQKTKNP